MNTEANDNREINLLQKYEDISLYQNVEIPNDLDPHSTNLYYKIRELSHLIYNQKVQLKDQDEMILGLKKEIDALKRSQAWADVNERDLRKAHERISQLEKQTDGLYDTEKEKIQHLKVQIEELKRAKDHEQSINKKNLEMFHQKIEAVNYIEMENRVNKEEIEDLKLEKQQLIRETEEAIRKKEINNQNKYSQLKKKMVENLAETKKNVTSLNLEYIDVTNKLTVLQNHQLIIQIEYQAEKIEELEKEKNNLLQSLHSLQRDLKVHQAVELNLAEKVKLKQKECKQGGINNEDNQSKLLTEYNIVEMQKDNHYHLEKRILALEKSLKTKTNEELRLKLNNNDLKHRINQYEKKYSGLFNFFEESLNNFFLDDDIAKNVNLYINIDQIQKCDFTIFTSEEKYSLLVLMMKYLLPIVSLNANSIYNIGNGIFQTNLNLITKKVNMNERYLKDRELKKAFLGKNNKIETGLFRGNNSDCLTNSIPILKKAQSEADPRLTNSKYKAVFV